MALSGGLQGVEARASGSLRVCASDGPTCAGTLRRQPASKASAAAQGAHLRGALVRGASLLSQLVCAQAQQGCGGGSVRRRSDGSRLGGASASLHCSAHQPAICPQPPALLSHPPASLLLVASTRSQVWPSRRSLSCSRRAQSTCTECWGASARQGRCRGRGRYGWQGGWQPPAAQQAPSVPTPAAPLLLPSTALRCAALHCAAAPTTLTPTHLIPQLCDAARQAPDLGGALLRQWAAQEGLRARGRACRQLCWLASPQPSACSLPAAPLHAHPEPTSTYAGRSPADTLSTRACHSASSCLFTSSAAAAAGHWWVGGRVQERQRCGQGALRMRSTAVAFRT